MARRRADGSRWMASVAALLVGGAVLGLLLLYLFLRDESIRPHGKLADLGESASQDVWDPSDHLPPAPVTQPATPQPAPASPPAIEPSEPPEPPEAPEPPREVAPAAPSAPAKSIAGYMPPSAEPEAPAAPAEDVAETPAEPEPPADELAVAEPSAVPPADAAPEADPGDYLFGLPPHESENYILYCDLSDEYVADALMRLERMHEEYSEVFAEVLKPSRKKQLVFVFTRREDLVAAGGHHFMPGISLVTNQPPGPRLMMINNTPVLDPQREHLLRHEGWHHFKHYEIPNRMPVWLDEGFAEYLAYGVWTGDSTVHGLIRAESFHVLTQAVQAGLVPLKDMIDWTDADWLQAVNEGRGMHGYAQAWSVVHFLMEADGGKYQSTLGRHVKDIVAGRSTQRSGTAIAKLDRRYRKWLGSLNQTSTHAKFYEVLMRMLCSYLGRAHARGQRFDSAEEFLAAARAGKLDLAPVGDEQWLPPTLMDECLWILGQLDGAYSGAGSERIEMVWTLSYPSGRPTLHLKADYVDIELVGTTRLRNGRVTNIAIKHLRPEPASLLEGKQRRLARDGRTASR